MAKATKSGKKGRKVGRGKRAPANARYLGEHRWESNKEKKVVRHLLIHPNDRNTAERAIPNYFRKKPMNYLDKMEYEYYNNSKDSKYKRLG
jgi:hypothetical protein